MTVHHPRPALQLTSPMRVLALLAGSLLLGAATSWTQGLLPEAFSSLANSVSGWTAATAVLVALTRPSLRRGAALGAVSFVCLVLGYTLAAELRGLSYDPVRWMVVGVFGGPFVGAAAAGTVGRSIWAAATGSGLLSGLLITDGVYGLTVVADTTSPVYWTGAIITGVLLVLAVAATRLSTLRTIAAQLAVTVLVVAGASGVYAALNRLSGA